MEQSDTKIRSSAMDIFRIFCAISVVAIHTKLFYDINSSVGYSIKHVATRIAVPFFFCIMGYFFTKKLEAGATTTLRKTILKLLKTYIFWSIIYVVFNLIKAKIYGNDGSNTVVWVTKTIWSSFRNFFTLGTNNYHLWFFPAAIYVILLTYYFYKHNKIKYLAYSSIILYIIAVIGSAYPRFAANIPILRSLITWEQYDVVIRHFFANALSFFLLGYFLANSKNHLKKNTMHDYIIEIILIILFIIENIYIATYQRPSYQSVTLSLYPLIFQTVKILLNIKTKDSSKSHVVAKWTKPMADYTYYSHILWRDASILFLSQIMGMNIENGRYWTLIFLITIAITLITGSVLYIFRKNNFIKTHIL